MALSKADIPIVLDRLADARPEWYDIGLALGLEPSDLDCLRKEYQNVKDCFTRMIIAWMNSSKNTKPKNWSSIATALKHKMVAHGELAAAIEEEFSLTPESEGSRVSIGEKRTSSSTQSEMVPKRPRLEQSCASNKAIQKQLEEHGRKIDIILQSKDTQIEKLKRENAKLNKPCAQCKELECKVKKLSAQLKQTEQRCEELEERVKEHSEQLQQLNKQIQTLQNNKKCENKDAIQYDHDVSTYIPKLSLEQSEQVDYNFLRMFTALSTAKEDWYKIGCSLEVSLHFLDTVKSKYGKDSHECLFWVVRKWLTDLAINDNKSCKVCILIEALESKLLQIRYKDIVDKIDEFWHPGCDERITYFEYPRFYPF